MRNVLVLSLLFAFAFVMESFAQVNFSFNGVGVHAGYVKPEDPIESSIGFGARAELGTFMKDNITMGALVDYWGKKYGEGTGVESTLSEVTIAPYLHYNFAMESSFVPYAGGGFGLALNSSEVTVTYLGYSSTASSSDTDFIIFGVGGAKMQINEKLTGFAEARYQIGNIDVLSLLFGVVYHLGQ